MDAGSIKFLSAGRSGAFLEWAWQRRSELSNTQRQGLVQAIYASLLGHIEAVMSEVLEDVYRRAGLAVNDDLVGRSEAVLESKGVAVGMLKDKQTRLESMTFDPLLVEASLALYPKFEQKPKRHKADLDAIKDLRNVFVHGRSLSLGLAPEPGKRIDTDRSKLKQAIDRLVGAGVIDRSDTHAQEADGLGGDEIRLFDLLHSDAAIMHLVAIGRTFQSELHEISAYPPELRAMNMFPDLKA